MGNTPITACTKEPRVLCAPAGCGFKEGREECYEKTRTVVQDAPKEQCTLEPQRTCKHVTKLVPKLEPTEECVDVPRRCAPGPGPTPGRSRSPLSRSGAMCPQRNLVLPKETSEMSRDLKMTISVQNADVGKTADCCLLPTQIL